MKSVGRGPRHRAPKDPKTLGQRIWAAREDRGLTQAALAAMLKLQQQTVASWEKDKSKPNGTAWEPLRRILGWSREALETGLGYRRPELAGVAESTETDTLPELPPPPPGTEVYVLSSEDLLRESQRTAAACRTLKEAVKAGRQVWLVLGPAAE